MDILFVLAKFFANRNGRDFVLLQDIATANLSVHTNDEIAAKLVEVSIEGISGDFRGIEETFGPHDLLKASQAQMKFESNVERLSTALSVLPKPVFRPNRFLVRLVKIANELGAGIDVESDRRASAETKSESTSHKTLDEIVSEISLTSQLPDSIEIQQAKQQLERINAIRTSLNAIVFGQPQVIEQLTSVLQQSMLNPLQQAPMATFMMLGGSGTGKTLTARTLKQAMGDDWHYVAVDMSAMVNYNQTQQLDGIERAYNNAAPGMLTSFVREHPQSVVVFDNVEKAHPAVISRLISIFTDGTMTDQFGFYKDNDPEKAQIAPPQVDFTRTVVVFTSKSLSHIHDAPQFKAIEEKGSNYVTETLRNALKSMKSNVVADFHVFNSGLLDYIRSDAYLVYKPLNLEHLAEIAASSFDQVQQQIRERFNCDITLEQPEALLTALTLEMAPNVNARSVYEQINKFFAQSLMEHSRTGELPKQLTWSLSDEAARQLEELREQSDDGDLLKWLMRKGLVVRLHWNSLSSADAPVIALKAITTEKVVHHEDTDGAGAVSIEVPDVRFSDIAGHLVVKDKLQQVLSLIKAPKVLQQYEVDLPKGMLLYGPPGTGKTMLAKALANEADLPFISVSGTELLDVEFLKAVFQRARKYAPSILFIDELDVIGNREHDSRFKVIVNQLLTEIDGFKTNSDQPVFIIAATNRPDDLDSALVRSGRIDIHIEVPPLDREAREYFLQRYLELPNDGSLDKEALLDISAGMSGADLEKVRRELVFFMLQHQLPQISQPLLMEFLNQRKYGHRSTIERTLEDRKMTAYHEAGHAVVSRILNPDIEIEQVNISSLGGTAGFVAFSKEQQASRRMTRQEMLEDIAVRLAGRYAEVHKYGEEGLCAGASQDLKVASELAMRAVSYFGLDDEIGLFSFAGVEKEFQVALAEKTLNRTQAWLNEAAALAKKTLAEHWPAVERVTELLLKHEVINGEALDSVL